MIAALKNAMRLQALRSQITSIVSRIGLVTSYDPDTFSVRVNLQPEQILTGWLPVGSQWIGNGWGMFAAPNIGDMVAVEFLDGDLEAGIVHSRFYNDVDRPLSVPSGEYWLVHASGAFFKLLNSGAATFSDGQGATLTLNGDGSISSQALQWTHQGAVRFTDDVQMDQSLNVNQDVVANGVSLVTHVHSGVQSGSSDTGPPA